MILLQILPLFNDFVDVLSLQPIPWEINSGRPSLPPVLGPWSIVLGEPQRPFENQRKSMMTNLHPKKDR